jgi:phage terminase large subunit GpA-like protein
MTENTTCDYCDKAIEYDTDEVTVIDDECPDGHWVHHEYVWCPHCGEAVYVPATH